MTTNNQSARGVIDNNIQNGTFVAPPTSDLFHKCWRRQSCNECISTHDPCAWCAVSQTCVPNLDHGTFLSILAPIRNENICPLSWRERWELRTRTFGCRCSTMTFMSVVVAAVSTMGAILLVGALVKLSKWIVGRWKDISKEWWRWDRTRVNWRHSTSPRSERAQQPEEVENTERAPLLG